MEEKIIMSVRSVKPDPDKILYAYKSLKSNKEIIIKPQVLLGMFRYVLENRGSDCLDSDGVSRLCYIIKSLYNLNSYEMVKEEII